MNYGFAIDNRRCIGCHACTVACKAEHDTPIGVNRTWVKYVEKGTFPDVRRTFTVHRCNHCADAPCVEICPVRSLYIRSDGIVDFDQQRCIGCKACMQACPYDALHIDPNTHTSSKCNYCAHRIDRGLEPACVVVCPVHAIVSGDLDDPHSEISELVNRTPVAVRKPEKGTRPKLYYVNSDAAALRPELAPSNAGYLQAEQSAGVGHFAGRPAAGDGSRGKLVPYASEILARAEHAVRTEVGQARRAYDIPQRGVLWGWEVSGYLWTKSIAAGVLFLPLLLQLGGLMELSRPMQVALGIISLVFLALTGALLVKDLDQPRRFLYVLLRPQFRSWLVRGAYIITAFGGVTTGWLLLNLMQRSVPDWLPGLIALLAVAAAVYTAFLLAQAKGRDLWQSPMLPVRMLVTSTMTGGAVVLLLSQVGQADVPCAEICPVQPALQIAIGLHLLLVLFEFLTPHVTTDTSTALRLMLHGPLRVPFWSALLLGNGLPLALLLAGVQGPLMILAAVLVLVFTLVGEHVWVRAPQLIPLS